MTSFSSSRGGQTDDKTELGRRYVQRTSEREFRRRPVSEPQETNFFSFQRPRNRFASLQLWQPTTTTTTRAPLFVLNPQPRMSSVQKTVTSMRPLKPHKNTVAITIGNRRHCSFNKVTAKKSNWIV